MRTMRRRSAMTASQNGRFRWKKDPPVQHEAVLQHQRRDPNIVRGYRRTLEPELTKNARVVEGGLIVREKHVNAVLEQKAAQNALVLGGSAAKREPRAKL